MGEAAWWAIQTVSTVGYGDTVPETGGGRTVAAMLMLVGIAVVPAVTSIVVAVLVGRAQERVGANRERHAEILERLERLEKALGERR
jgi:voltage-gated potassium channel